MRGRKRQTEKKTDLIVENRLRKEAVEIQTDKHNFSNYETETSAKYSFIIIVKLTNLTD